VRVYFISCINAGLKLNGVYAGVIGSFEKFIDIERGAEILAEAVPDGNFLPRNFFINDKFFSAPPPFADVYLCDGEAVVSLSFYESAETELKIIAQTNLDGLIITLFRAGGRVYLSCDGGECSLYELSRSFENAEISQTKIGGYPVATVSGKGCLCVISQEGKRVFYNPAESFKTGDMLEVTINFKSCAGYFAECQFAYDGREMKLVKSVTKARREVDESVMHFAFFESVLTGADSTRYLSDELKGKAGVLHEFLGDFVDVVIPHSTFYEKHGDIKAAGLVYPLSKNLFEVKYYAVDIVDDKIDNIKAMP